MIVGVEDFGFFCRLVEFPAEGLVHITALADDYYYLEGETHTLIGRRAGKRYRLGDRVEVTVARVDIDRRELDLTLGDFAPAVRDPPAAPPPARAPEPPLGPVEAPQDLGQAEEEGAQGPIEVNPRRPGRARKRRSARVRLRGARRPDLRDLGQPDHLRPAVPGPDLDPIPGPAIPAGRQELLGLARVGLVEIERLAAGPAGHQGEPARRDRMHPEREGCRSFRVSAHDGAFSGLDDRRIHPCLHRRLRGIAP